MSAPILTRRGLLGAALAATVAGCGRAADPMTFGADASTPLNVGVIRSRKGTFAGQGIRFEQGLRAGLLYSSSYRGMIGSRTIWVTWLDDHSDPERAAAAAEELLRRGIRLIAGGVSSASALRVAEVAERHKAVFLTGATDDRLTGLNRYTFRTGRQTYQDLAAARTLLPAGARVVVYGPDNTAATVLGAAGTVRDPAWIARTKPDVLFVAWPSTTPAATRKLWRGIPDGIPVVTVLGTRNTWPAYGPSTAARLLAASSWVDGAGDNGAYNALRVRVPYLRTDLGNPEGFAAGQLMIRVLQRSPDDPEGMVTALEGARLTSVKGDLQIRAEDHALLQPMFQAKLTWTGAAGSLTATTSATLPPEATAPPL